MKKISFNYEKGSYDIDGVVGKIGRNLSGDRIFYPNDGSEPFPIKSGHITPDGRILPSKKEEIYYVY